MPNAFEIWGNSYSSTDPNRFNYNTGTLLFTETNLKVNYTNTSIYSGNFATPTWLLSSDTYFFQSILNANENKTPFLCYNIVITVQ